MASSQARRSSDVDFADVFGGPPRRSAVLERGRSRADSLDSTSSFSSRSRVSSGRGDERRSSGLGIEKPVFGELGSSAGRRRNLGDNFFSDIFAGSDSGCSTPRKVDGDVFFSMPGSTELSFPVKMAKDVEHVAFTSAIHRFSHKSEDASEVTMFSSSPKASHKNRAGNLGRAFHNQTPLGDKFSHIIDSSLEVSNIESQSHKGANSLESYISSNKFHFSIYRWAGKGAYLALPSPKEGNGDASMLGRRAEVVIQLADLPSDNDNESTGFGGKMPDNQDYNSQNILERIGAADSASTSDVMGVDTESKSSNKSLNEKAGMINNKSEDAPVWTPDMRMGELRSLHQLFNDDTEQIGYGGDVRQSEKAESFMGGLTEPEVVEAKKEAQGEEMRDYMNEIKSVKQEDPTILEDKTHGSKVKGKVKEFMRIFSPEDSPKRKATFETGKRKPKGKERGKSKVEDIGDSVAKPCEEVKTSSANKVENIGVFVAQAYGELKTNSANKVEDVGVSEANSYKELKTSSTNKGVFVVSTPQVNQTRNNAISDYPPSFSTRNQPPSEMDINSKPSSVHTEKNTNHSASIIEESFKDPEECLVELSSGDQDEPLPTLLQQNHIKIADSKIRDWSKGKENNIRSLLSTLQYVLWPESGWRPVPLVDIIEGNSVKRAYQKALLCLHPDKLQQRGADVHQKYIAEKVFDILQEAWDEFNSVSAF